MSDKLTGAVTTVMKTVGLLLFQGALFLTFVVFLCLCLCKKNNVYVFI